MKSTIAITKENLSSGEIVFVASNKKIGIASQGYTISEAKRNLKEAVMLCKKYSPTDRVKCG